MEKRAFCNLELRSGDAGSPGTLTGYVLKYNVDSLPIPGNFVEQIAQRSVKLDTNVLALYWHKEADILGSTQAGTLRFKDDDVGLAVECDLPNTQRGRDVAEYVTRKDIQGWSFGFREAKDTWQRAKPMDRRTLTAFTIIEVSVTPLPYYPDTTIALRSRDADTQATEDAQNAQETQRRKNILSLASRV